jgi:hypothetical protein
VQELCVSLVTSGSVEREQGEEEAGELCWDAWSADGSKIFL